MALFTISIDECEYVSPKDLIAFRIMESVLGMIGDLIESGLKRYVSAKDASGLLPATDDCFMVCILWQLLPPFIY
jgi:CDP-diglyceride synthetase